MTHRNDVGHGSWGMGMPELMTTACSDALDVTRPELYDFLRTFLTEMGTIFDNKFLFLGGDELGSNCFDDSPTIAAWMKERGLNSSSTQQYFWQQMTAKVFPSLNKTISAWRADDPQRGPFAANLPAGSVLNVYQSLSTAWAKTVPTGIKTVVSMAGQKWYLDSQGNGYNQDAWKYVYAFQGVNDSSWLLNPSWSDSERALFLGGETAIWGEGINKDNFDAYVWRSASAAAERLWSSEQSLGCPDEICPEIQGVRHGQSYWLGLPVPPSGDRFGDQLCRMSKMGVRSGPWFPGFCPSDAGAGSSSSSSSSSLSVQQLQDELALLKRENIALKAAAAVKEEL